MRNFYEDPYSDRQNPHLLNKPVLDIPEFKNALEQIYKTGSIPLVSFFIGSILLFFLLGTGIITASENFIKVITYIASSLFFCGVATFVLLSILGYLRWKTELNTRMEQYKIDTECYKIELTNYESLCHSEMELQTEYLSIVAEQAGKIIAANPGMNPQIIETSMHSIFAPVTELLPEFMKARSQIKKPDREFEDRFA